MRSLAWFVRHRPLIRHRRGPCLALARAAPLSLAGCAATMLPPQRVTHPAQIGVLEHGHHSSLIMETTGVGMLRYSCRGGRAPEGTQHGGTSAAGVVRRRP